MVTDRLRVGIFASQQLLVEAVAEALAEEPGMDVVGRATSAAGALDLLRLTDVDVLLISVAVHDEGCLELARTALVRRRALGIVLMTEPGAMGLARDALEIGIRGWVRSDESMEHLLAAVRGVGAHDVYVAAALLRSALAGGVPSHESALTAQLLGRLTPRQSDVLRCLMDGCSREQTSLVLEMSPNTVRTHVGAILRRLQVHSTLAAVAVARRGGLLGWSHEEAPPAKGVGRLVRQRGATARHSS